MLRVGFVLGVGFELRVTPRVVARGGFISISILRPAPHHSTVIGTKRVRHRCVRRFKRTGFGQPFGQCLLSSNLFGGIPNF